MRSSPIYVVLLMLSSQVPPEETIGVARLAERTRFSRIWLTEDYYRKAAFASCAAVLGATSSHRGRPHYFCAIDDPCNGDCNAPPNVRQAV